LKTRKLFDFPRKFLRYWLPAIMIMTAIFIASSTPSYDLPSFGLIDTLVKKGGHMTGYFLLTLAYLRAINTRMRKAAFLVLGLALLYAVSDEFHQSFVPGRNPAVTDVLIDMVGASLAVWAEHIYEPLKRLVYAGLLNPPNPPSLDGKSVVQKGGK
jgi:VanZ family protein